MIDTKIDKENAINTLKIFDIENEINYLERLIEINTETTLGKKRKIQKFLRILKKINSMYTVPIKQSKDDLGVNHISKYLIAVFKDMVNRNIEHLLKEGISWKNYEASK